MTPARWAAVACLVAFAGVPVLSVLLTVGGSDDGGAWGPLLAGLLAALLLIGLIVVVVRRVVRDRVAAEAQPPDGWRR